MLLGQYVLRPCCRLLHLSILFTEIVLIKLCKGVQCDQIGRFFALWATIQSIWQQKICPNLLHSQAIFVKVSKSFIFIVKSFWATFINIWRFLSGHTAKGTSYQAVKQKMCWLYSNAFLPVTLIKQLGVVIAQWINLCPPSRDPEFESRGQHVH